MKERVPGDKGECGPKCPPHHWVIGDNNIGRCIKDGCTMARDFGAIQARIREGGARAYYRPVDQLPPGYIDEIEVGAGRGRDTK